jgi:hypothetical protein
MYPGRGGIILRGGSHSARALVRPLPHGLDELLLIGWCFWVFIEFVQAPKQAETLCTAHG